MTEDIIREDITRIDHMLQRIEVIRNSLKGITRDGFFSSRVLLDAVSFNFAIMGEAAGKLSRDLRRQYHDIPWKNIIGMRNILIHDYIKTDSNYMWEAATNNLEPLKKRLLAIREALCSCLDDC